LLTVNRPTKYLDICFPGESNLTFEETREERLPFLVAANMDDKNKLRKMIIP
jgi:hypothetical protein